MKIHVSAVGDARRRTVLGENEFEKTARIHSRPVRTEEAFESGIGGDHLHLFYHFSFGDVPSERENGAHDIVETFLARRGTHDGYVIVADGMLRVPVVKRYEILRNPLRHVVKIDFTDPAARTALMHGRSGFSESVGISEVFAILYKTPRQEIRGKAKTGEGRQGETTKDDVLEAKNQLDFAGAKIIGTILNDAGDSGAAYKYKNYKYLKKYKKYKKGYYAREYAEYVSEPDKEVFEKAEKTQKEENKKGEKKDKKSAKEKK